MRKRKTNRKCSLRSPTTSSYGREIVRRRKDKKAAEQRKHRENRRDRRRKAFAVMKWRLKAIRDYRARRITVPEHVAANQTAKRFSVSQRFDEKNYRDKGKRGLLLKAGSACSLR
ncbi:hypothetical protein H8E77_33745 [bacterium]|nr:hypothetical protein [bacterium]